MYNITQADKEFGKLIEDKIDEFQITFEKNFSTQESTLELLAAGVAFSDSMNYRSSKLAWNIACFVNIASYDLKILVKSLVFAKGEWEKRLFARQSVLLIYETTNDLFDLFGKDFRQVIAELPEKEKHEKTLKQITQKLNEFKTSHFKQLKTIRNVAVAHRDNDTKEQLKVIQSIVWVDAITIASEFDGILNMTGGLLQEVTGQTGDLDIQGAL